jgi:hypothetical protein
MECLPPEIRWVVAGRGQHLFFSPMAPGDILPGTGIDFTYVLPAGDTLTGAPSVAVDTTGLSSTATVPTFSSIGLTAGLAGATRSVSWTTTIPVKTIPGIYLVKVTATSSAGANLIRTVLLPVGNP